MNSNEIKTPLKVLLGVVIWFLPFIAKAQTVNQEFYKKPEIIEKSPDISSLFRYSDASFDYTSGTANINIPIYTIKQGRIVIPISISYNTGGIKVDEVASMVGLGWSLNFGGAISVEGQSYYGSRNVRTAPVRSSSQAIATLHNNYDYVWQLSNGYAQNEQEKYHFNVDGQSGMFFYDINNELQTSPSDLGLRIERIPTDMSQEATGFIITDSKGISYYFANSEVTVSTSSGGASFRSSYLPTKIIDNNTADEVDFYYSQKPVFTWCAHETMNYYKAVASAPGDIAGIVTDWNSTGSYTSAPEEQVTGLSVDSIVFKRGSVVFHTKDDRIDVGSRRLDNVIVLNKSDRIIKETKFSQGYFVSPDELNVDTKYERRLKLENVIESNGASTLDQYSFSYDESVKLPAYKEVYSSILSNNRSVDYWGYFNGANNSGLIPSQVPGQFNVTIPTFVLGDRNVIASTTKAFILNKVTYPTGGWLELEYENNYLPGYVLGSTIGGLRVKSLAYKSNSNSSPIKKEFSYLSARNLTPFLDYSKFGYTKVKGSVGYDPSGACGVGEYDTEANLSSDPIIPFTYNNGAPVFYDVVEESNYPDDDGKKIYSFVYNAPLYSANSIIELGHQYPVDNSWERGQLKSVVSLNNANDTVQKTVYQYSDFKVSYPKTGLYVFKHSLGAGTLECYDWVGSAAEYYRTYYSQVHMDSYYDYLDAYVSIGTKKLQKKIVTDYSGTDKVVKTYDYTYGIYDGTYLESTITENTSDGSSIKTVYNYPSDYSSTAVYSKMISNHDVSDIVKETRFHNTDEISSMERNFGLFNSSQLVALSNIKTSNNGGSFATEFTCDNYDSNGNLRQVTGRDGIATTYLWSYNNTYVVAKIENAQFSSVSGTGDDFVCSNFVNVLGKATNQSDIESLLSQLFSALKSDRPSCWPTMYVFQPLVGMISQMDLNGLKTYYDYDSFGRLETIQDNDYNFVKSFEYHYK
ncbi:hypothetical protein [Prolixibacter sp. NT017]|uniref:hypothetical protein n=1 Tax=Prolixibacter sp. NT017 TaxID=2652390 RepID=UPI0012893C03|nr:hypothetical protein [Prolixibacter sp. NT017]GET24693.1 hypothetical protein NT017_10220 [Prolixibacter sp. NT017]